MKVKGARMLGVSAFIAGGTILFGVWGCGSEPKQAAAVSKQAEATSAPAQTASTTEDAQVHALIERTAPEKAPASPATDTVKPEAAPPAVAAPAIATHVVRRGETLSSISQKYYGTKANWTLILDANRNVLKNPKDLKPNMKLVIPATKATTVKAVATKPVRTGTVLSATTTAPSATAPVTARAIASSAGDTTTP